jgi:large subunit ribosomal protein L7Ae
MKPVELPEELNEKIFEIIEISRQSGKIKKGTNEVTKAIEKGIAKIVITASDVTPPEVIMHLPLLGKEKNIPVVAVKSRQELGASAGLTVPTSSVAITEAGNAAKQLDEILKRIKQLE